MMNAMEIIDLISRIVVQGMLNSVWQGMLILLLLFGSVLLFRKISASTRYIILFGGFVVITLFPILNIVTNNDIMKLPGLFRPQPAVTQGTPAAFQALPGDIQSAADVSVQDQEIVSNNSPANQSISLPAPAKRSTGNFWQNFQFEITSVYSHIILFGLWFMVSVFMLFRLIKNVRKFLRSKQNNRPVPSLIRERFDGILKTYRVGRRIQLKSSASITVPHVSGIIRPEIVLPESMLNDFDSHELDQVMLHELAHVIRRDDWANLYQKFIESVLFFLPAVWLLKSRIFKEREESCDEFVLLRSGSRKEYASCLVKVAENLRFSGKPYLEFSMASSKNNLHKRIENILDFDPRNHKKTMITGIAIASVVILFGVYQILLKDPLLSILEQTYTVEFIDGVKTINNLEPKWGPEPIFELEFVRRIGELDSDDENLLFYFPQDIFVDNERNIYVLDAGNHRIQKFDTDMNFIASFGRKGQGPGEFDRPLSLDMDNKGNMFVLDNGNHRIIGIDPEGKEIKRIKLERSVFPQFLVSNTGNFIYPRMSDSTLVSVYDEEDSIIKEFGKSIYYDNFTLRQILNNFYLLRDPEGNIYMVFKTQNRIDKYTPEGELIFRTKRTLNFEETVDPEYELFTQTAVYGKNFDELVDIVVPNVSYNPIVFIGYNISFTQTFGGIDSEGRLWSASYISIDPPIEPGKFKEAIETSIQPYIQFEVFDSEGVLLGYLPLPDIPVPKKWGFGFRVFHDRVYIFDKSKEMSIFEYRIIDYY